MRRRHWIAVSKLSGRRAAAWLGTLAIGALVGAVGVGAAPATAASPADLAAATDYLVTTTTANNVTDGTSLSRDGYYESFEDYADFGLTIDGAFALAATGDQDTALVRVVDFLRSGRADGIGHTINSWTGIGTEYAGGGSLGKEALLAEATGYDPRNFGGHDLIAALQKAVCTTGGTVVCAAPGAYTYAPSTFSQTLAIIAQLRAGDTEHAAAPIDYLLSLQNANGAWPSVLPSTGDSEVDSTAMAVMALALVHDGQRAAPAAAAVAKGIAWIAGQQESDGGFPGAAGDSTNSAALAIQVLSLSPSRYGEVVAAARAFLAAQQNADGGFNVAAGGQSGSDVRASTQVVGGLVGTSFGDLHHDIAGTTAPPSDPPSSDPPSRTPPASRPPAHSSPPARPGAEGPPTHRPPAPTGGAVAHRRRDASRPRPGPVTAPDPVRSTPTVGSEPATGGGVVRPSATAPAPRTGSSVLSATGPRRRPVHQPENRDTAAVRSPQPTGHPDAAAPTTAIRPTAADSGSGFPTTTVAEWGGFVVAAAVLGLLIARTRRKEPTRDES